MERVSLIQVQPYAGCRGRFILCQSRYAAIVIRVQEMQVQQVRNDGPWRSVFADENACPKMNTHHGNR
jgi:hypothetical protein